MPRKWPRRTSKGLMAVQKRGCAEALLRGVVLSIDPASGAGESLPGYALLRAGELVESGVIDVGGPDRELHERLFELGRSLREDFDGMEVDVLIVEDVPLKRFHKGGGSSIRSQVTLHRSIGTVLGAVRAQFFVPIHPATWHAHAGEDHEKGDEQDAIAMGRCALAMAADVLGKRNVMRRSRKR